MRPAGHRRHLQHQPIDGALIFAAVVGPCGVAAAPLVVGIGPEDLQHRDNAGDGRRRCIHHLVERVPLGAEGCFVRLLPLPIRFVGLVVTLCIEDRGPRGF
jgi:hypothetical protein